ncbi:hypothetical protein BJ508DRAFT_365785 [Ascobolus immersus RN42]|uniref:VWFA domain-containing protein n=1 Tax=Ascobolus immersus RN42 TaxID=1160509 RepID=A0A3N4HTC6_ASCIM|nr:hypothetical protein BJ508DRAFT_365785 [Ascobolus immersus RN42]
MSRPPLSAILNPPQDTSLFASLKRRTQQEVPFSFNPTERLDVVKTRNPPDNTDRSGSSGLRVRKIRQRRRASDSEVLPQDNGSDLSLPTSTTRTPVSGQLFPSNNYDFETTPKATRFGTLRDSVSSTGSGSEYSYSNNPFDTQRTSYSGTPTPVQDFGFWNLSGLLAAKDGKGSSTSTNTRQRSNSFGKVMEFKRKDTVGPSGLRRASAGSALMSDVDEDGPTSNDTSRSVSVSDLRDAATDTGQGKASRWKSMVSPMPSRKGKKESPRMDPRMEPRIEPPPFGANSFGPLHPSPSVANSYTNSSNSNPNSYYQHPGREIEQNPYVARDQGWQPLHSQPSVSGSQHHIRDEIKSGGKRFMSVLFPLKKKSSTRSSTTQATGVSSSMGSLHHQSSANSRMAMTPPKRSLEMNRSQSSRTPSRQTSYGPTPPRQTSSRTTPPRQNTANSRTPPRQATIDEYDEDVDYDVWSTPPSRVNSVNQIKKSPNGSAGSKSPATVITSVEEESESESETSVADQPFVAWREGRSKSTASTTPSPSGLRMVISPPTSQYGYQGSKNGYLHAEPMLPWSDGKRGRPPFLRLAVEATSEVDKIEARGQQGCWVAVVVRAEVCPGDWDLGVINEFGRGLDVVLVLDISAYTSPASFPALLAAAKDILLLLNQEKDSVAIITVTADPGSRNSNMPAAVETVHFLSPATKTITRHLISVVENLKQNNFGLHPKTRPLKKAITQAAGLFSARHTDNARHILFLSASELPENCTDGLALASDISVHKIAIGPCFMPSSNVMSLAPLGAHLLGNPNNRVLKANNNSWSIPFVGRENTGVKRYILPSAPDIPMLLSFLRSDVRLGVLENVRLSLQPGTNCRIEQALGNLEMRKLTPGESAIICVKLIVGPTTGLPMDPSDPSYKLMMNGKTGLKPKLPLIVTDDEETADRWSVLEQHLEATLGELNTTILTAAAYYNHPLLDSGDSSVVSITERVAVRRYVKGSIWDVSAAFDANGMMRRGERVVRQSLLQALANEEGYIYAEHIPDFDVLGGDELEGWRELRQELEYLSEREFISTGSAPRDRRYLDVSDTRRSDSMERPMGRAGLGTFSTTSTSSWRSPSYPPSPYPTLNLTSEASGASRVTLGLHDEILNDGRAVSFNDSPIGSPYASPQNSPASGYSYDSPGSAYGEERYRADDEEEGLLDGEVEVEYEEEEEEDEARKIWQQLGFIPKGSVRRRAEVGSRKGGRERGDRRVDGDRDAGGDREGNSGLEEIRRERGVRWEEV